MIPPFLRKLVIRDLIREHSLAQGLVLLTSGSNFVDLVSGSLPTSALGYGLVDTPYGAAMQMADHISATLNYSLPAQVGVGGSTDISYMIMAKVPADGIIHYGLQAGSGTGQLYSDFMFNASGAGGVSNGDFAVRLYAAGFGSAVTSQAGGSAYTGDGQYHVYGCTIENNVSISLYFDGIGFGGGGTIGTVGTITPTSTFTSCALCDFPVVITAIWNRRLLAVEHLALATDIGQIFRQNSNFLDWYVMGAAAAVGYVPPRRYVGIKQAVNRASTY